MDNARMDRKYTHENRAELLAAIKLSAARYNEAVMETGKIAEQLRESRAKTQKLYEVMLRLKLSKDEHGFYLTADNYEAIRAKHIACPTHAQVRESVVAMLRRDISVLLIRNLLLKYGVHNVSALSTEQMVSFYEDLKLL